MENTIINANDFVSLIDTIETLELHTKSDNITIMRGVETEDVLKTKWIKNKNEEKQLLI